jgi:hypothetical protein
MRTLAILILGPIELARLAVISRFRLRGKYWSWRWHTAFGRGTPPRGQLLMGLLRYAHWAGRMRRL